jgi:hypothetical protein
MILTFRATKRPFIIIGSIGNYFLEIFDFKEFSYFFSQRMSDLPMPEFILNKLNQKRAEKGLPPFEEEEKQRKEFASSSIIDVSLI